MLDTNGLKKWCKDIVHSYIEADFDSASGVFRSQLRNCLQSLDILAGCNSESARDALEGTIFAELQKHFRHWAQESGSSHELIIWLEGFFVGVNSGLQM